MNKAMQKFFVWSLFCFFYAPVSLCADFDAPQKKRLGKPIQTLKVLACKQVVKQLSSSAYMDHFEHSPEEVERELWARVNNLPAQRMIAVKLLESYKSKITARNIVKGPLFYKYRDNHPIDVLQFNADESCLAVAASNERISLWDTGTGEKLFQLDSPAAVRVTALAFDPSSNHLAVGSDFGHKLLYDLVNRQQLHELRFHHGGMYVREIRVNVLAYSPDGKLLLSGDAAGALCIWDAQAGNHLRTMLHGSLDKPFAVFTIQFLSDAIFVEAGREWKLWDITTGECLERGYDRCYDREVDSRRDYWLWNAGDESITFRDSKSAVIHQIALKGYCGLNKLSPDGSQVAVGTEQGVQILYAPVYEEVLEGIGLMQALYVYKKLKEQERSLFTLGWEMVSSMIWSQKSSPTAESYFKQMQKSLPDSFKRVLK